jgi:hypothetical protein
MATPWPDVPEVSLVVEEFRRTLVEPDRAPQSGTLELLLALHRNNAVQWDREDAARRADADDRVVADAKRDIDALNAKRHEIVEAIDAALATAIVQSASAPPLTESPAMVFDRLSVLVLRIASTEAAANSNGADRDRYAARLPLLREQLTLLQAALTASFDDVYRGRKRFVPYQSFKLYGPRRPSRGDSHLD